MKIRNKNAILELLQGGVEFEQIVLTQNLDQDELTQQIVAEAAERHIPIADKPHHKMAKRRSGETREALFAEVAAPEVHKLSTVLQELDDKREDPFFLILNRVGFASNIGLIARTAFAAGVNGLIFQGDVEEYFNEDTLHFSLGTIARMPLIKMNIFEALKELQKNAVETFCVQMGGEPYYQADLTGAAAFVLGAEREGASDTIAARCEHQLSIPMRAGIDSLNVSASAAVVLYEKIRQQSL